MADGGQQKVEVELRPNVVVPAGVANPAADPFATLLARIERDRAQLFGSEAARVSPVKRLSRRYSEVMRLRVDDGARASYAFLKINRAGQLPAELERVRRCLVDDFAHQQRAYEAMKGVNQLAVARPIACFPDELAVMTEEVSGETLEERLARGVRAGWLGDDGELQRAFELVGQWLATFHARGGPGGTLPLHKIRAYVSERLELVEHHGGLFGATDRRRLLQRFDDLASRLTPGDLSAVPVHGDFSLENVLVDGDRVTVIDFDIGAGATGTRVHDAAYLFVSLERLKAKPWLRTAQLERLQRALLRGLDPSLTPEQPLFQLLLLQHLVCHLVEALDANHGPLKRLYSAWLWRPCRTWLGL